MRPFNASTDVVATAVTAAAIEALPFTSIEQLWRTVGGLLPALAGAASAAAPQDAVAGAAHGEAGGGPDAALPLFRVRAHVFGAVPLSPLQWAELDRGTGGGVGPFELLLDDFTGRLRAELAGADAAEFLRGARWDGACGAVASAAGEASYAAREAAVAAMDRLLGTLHEEGVWVDVGLLPYLAQPPPASTTAGVTAPVPSMGRVRFRIVGAAYVGR
jgi:hypothetical protein